MSPHEPNGDMLHCLDFVVFFPLCGTLDGFCASGKVIRASCDTVMTIRWTFNFGRNAREQFFFC